VKFVYHQIAQDLAQIQLDYLELDWPRYQLQAHVDNMLGLEHTLAQYARVNEHEDWYTTQLLGVGQASQISDRGSRKKKHPLGFPIPPRADAQQAPNASKARTHSGPPKARRSQGRGATTPAHQGPGQARPPR
jgi:hypothetical protein